MRADREKIGFPTCDHIADHVVDSPFSHLNLHPRRRFAEIGGQAIEIGLQRRGEQSLFVTYDLLKRPAAKEALERRMRRVPDEDFAARRKPRRER